MKFVDLKKYLRQNVNNNYLLLGNDDFLIERSSSLIKESQNFEPEELNVIVFREAVDAKDVVNAANTLPMFAEYKLVYLDLTGNSTLQNADEIVKYLAAHNKETILVINAGNNKELAKKFSAAMTVDCNKLNDQMVFVFIKSELAKWGKTMTLPAMQLLSLYASQNLTTIVSELQKLSSYVSERSEINENDVATVCTKNVEYQLFDLTEALARQNTAKVYELLGEILIKKDNEKVLLPLIYNHFRRLLFVALSREGDAALAKQLKVKEYAVTKARQQSKLFSRKNLKIICEMCLQQDFAVKNGDRLVSNAISLIVVEISNLK